MFGTVISTLNFTLNFGDIFALLNLKKKVGNSSSMLLANLQGGGSGGVLAPGAVVARGTLTRGGRVACAWRERL